MTRERLWKFPVQIHYKFMAARRFNGTFLANSSVLNFNGSCIESMINGNDTTRFGSVIVNNIYGVTVVSGAYELTELMSIQAGGFETNDSLTIIS